MVDIELAFFIIVHFLWGRLTLKKVNIHVVNLFMFMFDSIKKVQMFNPKKWWHDCLLLYTQNLEPTSFFLMQPFFPFPYLMYR